MVLMSGLYAVSNLLVIARNKVTKQSPTKLIMSLKDCFAMLAMTNIHVEKRFLSKYSVFFRGHLSESGFK